jgi:hypothetical protein
MKNCKPHCVCKCNTTGCECWDGVKIEKTTPSWPVWSVQTASTMRKEKK